MTIRELVYELVNSGRVIKDNGKVILLKRDGLESKSISMNKGYEYWRLAVNGKIRQVNISQITWVAYGNNLEQGKTVDHIDRNRSNNHISNLRLASPREQNLNKAPNKKGYFKLSMDRRNQVLDLIKLGLAKREISRRLNMHRATITKLVNIQLESVG